MYCKQNLEVAEQFARNALNNLHSIIFKMTSDKYVTQKYHWALHSLQKILYKYIDQMAIICNKQFSNSKKLNNNSGYFQNYGPKPDNFYGDPFAKFQFELY
jgi:hypothetical protein